jgi:hypothetical protein
MSKHELGDKPIEPEYHALMNELAGRLDDMFNPMRHMTGKRKTGFVLLTFPYGATDGRCNFISNGANRQDIVVLFKEMIARFEGQPEQSGRA